MISLFFVPLLILSLKNVTIKIITWERFNGWADKVGRDFNLCDFCVRFFGGSDAAFTENGMVVTGMEFYIYNSFVRANLWLVCFIETKNIKYRVICWFLLLKWGRIENKTLLYRIEILTFKFILPCGAVSFGGREGREKS